MRRHIPHACKQAFGFAERILYRISTESHRRVPIRCTRNLGPISPIQIGHIPCCTMIYSRSRQLVILQLAGARALNRTRRRCRIFRYIHLFPGNTYEVKYMEVEVTLYIPTCM